jgi:hypothetical protein
MFFWRVSGRSAVLEASPEIIAGCMSKRSKEVTDHLQTSLDLANP